MKLSDFLILITWLSAFSGGAYLLVVNLIKTRCYETTLISFGLGLILQTWIANLLVRFIEVRLSFILSAVLVLIAGLVVTILKKNFKTIRQHFCFPLSYWLFFALATVIFLMIGRGLAIFDDYQNIPVTSILASGVVPPVFVLNPGLSFDYHYLMLLNAAQWVRLADVYPWTALDITRALFFSLTLVYTAFLARRVTRSAFSGWISVMFMAFAGGVRWLLLFLPNGLMERVSAEVEMMGTGLATAGTLKEALTLPWVFEGGGSFPFPFAFGNGYHTIAVMKHDGTGLMGTAMALLIILFFQKWRGTGGIILVSILITAMALIDEIWFIFFLAACGLILFIFLIRNFINQRRHWGLLLVLLVIIPAIIALFQGGVITGAFNNLVSPAAAGVPENPEQYFSMSFLFRWPPAFVSANLGVLKLTNWQQLIVALAEVGPILLLIPLFTAFSRKAMRAGQWIYVILGLALLFSLGMVFFEYQGLAGFSASKRLTLFATDLLILFAIPLLWLWLANKAAWLKSLTAGLVWATMLAGMVYFGIETLSVREPVLSYFLEPLDARVYDMEWNRLEPDAMVFDILPTRSATIFARPLRTNLSWYVPTDEFLKQVKNPLPGVLQAAGYRYFYYSNEDWEFMTGDVRLAYADSCVQEVLKVSNREQDYRRLVDVSACK